MDNAIFTTMDVLRFARPDMGDESFEKISFYVKDPAEIDAIAEAVQNLSGIDPTDFIVSIDRSDVDAVTDPLENISSLVTALIILVLAVGAAVLYLTLSIRVKERVHESGVLLSLGLSKKNITAQYLSEILVIAVVAFSLSALVGNFISKTVGGRLLDYTVSESAQEGTDSADIEAESGTNLDGIQVASSSDYAPKFESTGNLTEIEVKVEPTTVAAMYIVGFLIICAAVLAAVIPILKMKPREILSQMS